MYSASETPAQRLAYRSQERSGSAVGSGAKLALRAGLFGCLVLSGGMLLSGCIARSEGTLHRLSDDDAGDTAPILDAGTSDVRFDLPDAAAHALFSIEPHHGPFTGGQLATLRGNGFSSQARVWLGAQEVPAADVLAVDATRLQITIPPGEPGLRRVRVQNGDDEGTRAELANGYTYDSFYASPKSSPTSGGTRIRLHGYDTGWAESTQVLIDLKPCTEQQFISPKEIDCVVPPNTPGSKPIRVETEDGSITDILDAFIYSDSDDGFRGGLSGGALKDQLKVIALDNYSGSPIHQAEVFVSLDAEESHRAQTNAQGIAQIQATGLGPRRSITLAKECYHPVTFIDVPVDTLTVFLTPVLSIDCIDQDDPPAVGGSPVYGANIQGELIWRGGQEFQKAGWNNVPAPSAPGEQQAAYIFRFTSDPTRGFQLPNENARITPDSPGDTGYSFNTSVSAGNISFYALAGIENRTLSPPTFIAYSMGVVQGISAEPARTVRDVFIPITIPLDQAVTLDISGPAPTLRGPDRIRASVAVRFGGEGFAILPTSGRTELLPMNAALNIVGVPALIGDLTGGTYVAGARAFTGSADLTPRSIVGLRAQKAAHIPISLGPFVEVPRLTSPSLNHPWNGKQIEMDWEPGGAEVDLTVVKIGGNSGLFDWMVIAPHGKKTIHLPDTQSFPALGLKPGSVTLSLSTAQIEDFDYGNARYRQFGSAGWTAYATDVFELHHQAE